MAKKVAHSIENKLIGVVGGMGPYAGLDLVRKIFDQTTAQHDQEHLPVVLLSLPHRVPDRTAFLAGQSDLNPAGPVTEILRQLDALGAVVAGMPCNTAHVPVIFDKIVENLQKQKCTLRLLNLVEETVRYVQERHPAARIIGVLSTNGSYRQRLYEDALHQSGLTMLLPDEATQEAVQAAIYDPQYGIKARSNPVTETARGAVLQAIDHLASNGADAFILGCTELPLAVPETHVNGQPIIDSTLALARALIRETYPEKLRIEDRG